MVRLVFLLYISNLWDGAVFNSASQFSKYISDVSREAVFAPTFSSDWHEFLFFQLPLQKYIYNERKIKRGETARERETERTVRENQRVNQALPLFRDAHVGVALALARVYT